MTGQNSSGSGKILHMANNSARNTISRAFVPLVAVLAIAACIWPAFVQAQAKPAITYTLDFPGSDPAHYVLIIAADGHGSYESDGRLFLQAQPGEKSRIDFTLSPATKAKIFDLAGRVRAPDQRKEKHKIASTGAKTLSVDEGHEAVKITYDYSPVVYLRDLTLLFQRLSNTLEFGRRLQYEYHYQKLALDDDMKLPCCSEYSTIPRL